MADKEKKPGLVKRLVKWLREMRSELKKVSWPTIPQLINNTCIVLVAIVIVGAVVALLDLVFTNIVTTVIDIWA